jgi:protein O-mannosyl-transferase
MRVPKTTILCGVLAAAVLAAYANHFNNGFHFDDFHSITQNLFIRDLHNVPRFFTSTQYSSTLPDHRIYRPVVSTSLALDYRMGHGLTPFWFHLSTFLWFLLQLILMFLLFRRIMDLTLPHPSNVWVAFFAALCYGLHPANAETVNYVVQRADLYCTLGIVAGLLWFAARPEQRKYGWYLIPVALAYLSKPPALIFPAILLLYVFLLEQQGSLWGAGVDSAGRGGACADPERSSEHVEAGAGAALISPRRRGAHPENAQKIKRGDAGFPERPKWKAAFRATVPALMVTAAFALLQSAMTPANFAPGAQSGFLYRVTQPYVAVYYFKSFFLPTELSADTDWSYVHGPLGTDAVVGYVFVAALLGAAVWASRRRHTRPIAFGLLWFFLALLPTSLMPLAEVTNDHRMFFPFVGLALAVFWGLRLVVAAHPGRLRAAVAAIVLIFAAEAFGTHQRNNVWHTEESLWRDVTEKSPRNGRGLMNYGLVLMARGDYTGALSYMERALAYTPNYSTLEINLGIANGGLRRNAEAQRHFERAIALTPNTPDPYFFYARWLDGVGDEARAAALLETALTKDRLAFDARHLLLKIYAAENNQSRMQSLARETLQLAPNDEVAQRYLSGRVTLSAAALTAPAAHPAAPTPEQFLDESLALYQSGQYVQSILAARAALKLRPDYPEAYNNIAAASNALGRWDEGIRAANEALRLNPNFTLARNNLQWALRQKDGSKRR